MVSKERRAYSRQQGDLAEQRFIDACLALKYEVKKATAQEDMYSHIDYWVKRSDADWYGVDVKGNRHPQTIWVEFKNVRGDDGWLNGLAEFIAFDIAEEGGFVVIRRQELLEWCILNVSNEFVTKDKAHRHLYQREGREDVLTKLHLEDLKELKSFKLLRYANT